VFDVTVIGSANLDLVVRTNRHPQPGETVVGSHYAEYPGGKGLNQAVAAARSGASTAFIGAVGTDAAGHTLLDVARRDGIDVAQVASIDQIPTGRALITVDQAGENSIVVVPGANAAVVVPASCSATVVLGQLETPIEVVSDAFLLARAAGATTILNPAPAARLPASLLAACDIVIPNEHEVALLGGVASLFAAGVSTVITTLGERGIDVRTSDGECHTVRAHKVAVVDTTAAGDTFCGALAARLSTGSTIVEAATWAVAASALTVGRRGAIPSIPDATATQRFLDRLSS
jgi:ribokinase